MDAADTPARRVMLDSHEPDDPTTYGSVIALAAFTPPILTVAPSGSRLITLPFFAEQSRPTRKKMAGRIKRYAATVAPFCSAVDIQEPIDCGEPTEAVIGASIGIAVFPDDGDDALSLVEAADRAMYEVKKAGKNDAKLASEVPE